MCYLPFLSNYSVKTVCTSEITSFLFSFFFLFLSDILLFIVGVNVNTLWISFVSTTEHTTRVKEKMIITHPHVAPNLYELLSSVEH